MLHTNFQGHRPFGSREEDFKGFYHICAWRPLWSCDLDHLNELSFPHPTQNTNEIWLQSADLAVKKVKVNTGLSLEQTW